MAVPTELTLKNIREYFLARENFTVSNFELVKHFKSHLTDPATKGKLWSIVRSFAYRKRSCC